MACLDEIDVVVTESDDGAAALPRSGNFRRMPNHHVYIYDGGRVTNVVTSWYQNVSCLIGAAACDLATLTGWYGSF